MRILRDADVERLLTPERARAAMREALAAAWRGEFAAPPRRAVDLDGRRLTLTAGAAPGRWYGYRTYLAPGSDTAGQAVVVHDDATGRIRGVAEGAALGLRRSGAIGGVALDLLGPAEPAAIALLGAGAQAWHQLWALPERFRRAPVRVFARRPDAREQFAAAARDRLGLDVTAAQSPREAVDGADVVLLATSSPVPVVEPALLSGARFVATAGPKQVGRAEFEAALATPGAILVTDSPAQLAGYDPPHVLAAAGLAGRVRHLGEWAAAAGPDEDPGRAVFFNVGLAGTEAWLLAALLDEDPVAGPVGPLDR